MHCKLKQYQVHHADRKNKELQNVGRAGEMEECEGGKDWLGIKFLPVSHEITLHRSHAPVETWAEKTLQRRRGILEGGVEMGIRRSQFRGGREMRTISSSRSSGRGKKRRSSKWDFIGEGKACRQPFQRAAAGAYQLHTALSLKMNINPSLVISQ